MLAVSPSSLSITLSAKAGQVNQVGPGANSQLPNVTCTDSVMIHSTAQPKLVPGEPKFIEPGLKKLDRLMPSRN